MTTSRSSAFVWEQDPNFDGFLKMSKDTQSPGRSIAELLLASWVAESFWVEGEGGTLVGVVVGVAGEEACVSIGRLCDTGGWPALFLGTIGIGGTGAEGIALGAGLGLESIPGGALANWGASVLSLCTVGRVATMGAFWGSSGRVRAACCVLGLD